MFDITDLLAKYNAQSAFVWTLDDMLSLIFNLALEHDWTEGPFVLNGFTADETEYILDYIDGFSGRKAN